MLLGFKKQFVKPIQIGTKVFTMRNKRKVEPKIGETLHMYTGLRTANCSLISNKEKLISTQNVMVDILVRLNSKLKVEYANHLWIRVDGKLFEDHKIEEFVKFDGFSSIDEFIQYWLGNAPKAADFPNPLKEVILRSELVMYHWTDLRF